jgi:CubicO group peptidase (beta-lactamase class C family)
MADFDLQLLEREATRPSSVAGDRLHLPLRRPPGTEYEYNTLAFAVLGELIHRLDGRDYPEYLADEIFGPLE